uniref:Ig-like domain-containing protein n=1 Tax=Esox lucius TaxID=8010 RepID=A0AAY5K2F9_ESOLU
WIWNGHISTSIMLLSQTLVSTSDLDSRLLMVFPRSEPLTEFFSEGEEVVLTCNSELSDQVGWFRNTSQGADVIRHSLLLPEDLVGRKPQVLIGRIPEDLFGRIPKYLIGRINVSLPNSSLVISNLKLEDSGEYWCCVLDVFTQQCQSVTKTFLLKRDPFGINSMFYRVYSSLMACALLGMVCVLITKELYFNLN